MNGSHETVKSRMNAQPKNAGQHAGIGKITVADLVNENLHVLRLPIALDRKPSIKHEPINTNWLVFDERGRK